MIRMDTIIRGGMKSGRERDREGEGWEEGMRGDSWTLER